jgi:hypothetical protein
MNMRLLICLASLLVAANAQAVDYLDAKITGIGIVAGEEHIRFTIDKDPNAIFVTNQFSGEQLKRLVALITAAYMAESSIYMVRSAESSSSTQRHYTNVLVVSIGSYTFD